MEAYLPPDRLALAVEPAVLRLESGVLGVMEHQVDEMFANVGEKQWQITCPRRLQLG